jgi:hypothetical protein
VGDDQARDRRGRPEGEHLAGHVSAVVAASGTSAEPDVYGRTVARTLLPDVLPDVLPYVVGTPASFGFATRNGRTGAIHPDVAGNRRYRA